MFRSICFYVQKFQVARVLQVSESGGLEYKYNHITTQSIKQPPIQPRVWMINVSYESINTIAFSKMGNALDWDKYNNG